MERKHWTEDPRDRLLTDALDLYTAHAAALPAFADDDDPADDDYIGAMDAWVQDVVRTLAPCGLCGAVGFHRGGCSEG